MKYCFDTSALIDLGERHYPEHIKVFKPIWDCMYDGIENGEIVSVDYVAIEIGKKADEWRVNFLKKANGMFAINEMIEQMYGVVISEIESNGIFLVNSHRERFFKGADPWLIALARSEGECTIVSGETKKLAHYGLGPVCKALDIKHMNLLEFFVAKKIGF